MVKKIKKTSKTRAGASCEALVAILQFDERKR